MQTPATHLELRFERDSDGTGELFVLVQRGLFSGSGSAWFSHRDIAAFGRQLRDTFPLPSHSQIRLMGGNWTSRATEPELEEVLAGICVYPIGTTGQIGIQVEVMDGKYVGQRPESRARLKLEILSDYESIRTFGEEVILLLEDDSAIARLHAT